VPLGDGHAIKCAAHLIRDDEPVLIMFGDTLYDSQVSPARQVIDTFEKYGDPVVGLSEVAQEEVNKFGVIDGLDLGDGNFEIKKFVEKPNIGEAPSNLAAVGIYAITPEVIHTLQTMKEGKKLEGEWLDTGNKFNFIKATIKLGLKDEEIGNDLRQFLQDLKVNL
jgi:UTP--glucose-1-phosphate uridylyltransferase